MGGLAGRSAGDAFAMSSTDVRDDQLPRGAGSAGEVPPRPSASVILLQEDAPFRVLMMRRTETSTFVPGAWVFPGGAVEEQDRTLGRQLEDGGDAELLAAKIAAVRELFEESGIWLGETLDEPERHRAELIGSTLEVGALRDELGEAMEHLVLTARWVTPVGVPKRFETWFFLAPAPAGSEGSPDEREGLELIWVAPDEALQRHQAGEFPLVFPTIKTLETLQGWRSIEELLAARRSAVIGTTRPVLIVEGGRKRIVLPE